MEEWKNKYLEHLTKVKAVSRDYLRTVTGRIDKLLQFLEGLGIENITDVKREHISQYEDMIIRKNVTQTTKIDELRATMLFFKFLHNYEYIQENPALVIDIPRKPFQLPRDILGEHEIAYLLRLPAQHDLIGIRDFCIMSLLYSSMMRTKEIFNLKLPDIDLKSKQILVKRPKNKRDRIVHIDGYTAFFLQKYIKNVRPWLLKDGNSENLFISATGSDLKRTAFAAHFTRKYRPAIKEKFKKDVSPYVFRHSSATHWLDSGARKKKDVLAYVQRQLGHESLESTAIYTHIAIEPLRQMFQQYHPRELQFKKLHAIPSSSQKLIDYWDKRKGNPPPDWPAK
jgi:integrase/recombinase XerD